MKRGKLLPYNVPPGPFHSYSPGLSVDGAVLATATLARSRIMVVFLTASADLSENHGRSSRVLTTYGPRTARGPRLTSSSRRGAQVPLAVSPGTGAKIFSMTYRAVWLKSTTACLSVSEWPVHMSATADSEFQIKGAAAPVRWASTPTRSEHSNPPLSHNVAVNLAQSP